MDIKLSQHQTQKMILSPQIQQYLKLLQLPITELTQNVEQELLENPVLEYDLEAPDAEEAPQEPSQPESKDTAESRDELAFDEKFDILEKLDENFRETYSRPDVRHESLEDLEKQHDFRESLITKKTSLSDFLIWQISFLTFDETEKKIAEEVIGNLSNDGYFRQDKEEIAELFRVSPDVVERVVSNLQTLDPAGIFGRNLQEVLLLQVERRPADAEHRLAYRILKETFDLFEKRNYPAIAKALEVSVAEVERAAKLISTLEPKPGRIFYQDDNPSVVPDATIYPPELDGQDYHIDIHHESVPTLRISQYYKNLIKDKNTDPQTRDYIKQKINAGFWFMKALDQRKSTLRLITEQIVIIQREFFEKGFSFLKPLTLRDIAERINIHESTVSRALSGKYVSTPQGTIPYKSFFSNRLATTSETVDESQKSVMEKLRAIIEAENQKKPLSDSKIVTLMKADGILIARRTVAKYREMMRILPSHLRKSHS